MASAKSNTEKFDAVVIGLGAVGSAALYQLAKRGKRVLGIDQFSPPHCFGSSHGDTRIIRHTLCSQGAEYFPIIQRSYAIWGDIQKETGKKLLTVTGGLIIGANNRAAQGATRYLENAVKFAERFDIVHTILSTKEIQKRFPQFILCGNEVAYFEATAGYLNPELCVQTLLQLSQKYGAKIHRNEKVIDIVPINTNSIVVKTVNKEYLAEKVILSLGAWLPSFINLHSYATMFKVYKQVQYWFDPKNYMLFTPDKFPVFMWAFSDGSEKFVYGFPAIDGKHGGVKVATEQYLHTEDPDEHNRTILQEEIDVMYQSYIKDHLQLTNDCIKAKSCLYTVTPDSNFIIDVHPECPNIIVASACSGHGFKHSVAVGEILSELAVDGTSKIDISKFGFKRFSV